MTQLNDYNDDRKLITNSDEPLNEQNFERYRIENGEEKSLGYLQAVADFISQIDNILDRPSGNNFTPNTPAIICRELKKFHREKILLLQSQNFSSEEYQNENTQLKI